MIWRPPRQGTPTRRPWRLSGTDSSAADALPQRGWPTVQCPAPPSARIDPDVPAKVDVPLDPAVATASASARPFIPAPLRRMLHVSPDWDVHLVSGQQTNFENTIELMVGFQGSAQWNVYKGWAPATYGYLNVFAESFVSYAANQLDSDSAVLWLPFGPPSEGAGTYARRSQDLRSETYRAGFAARCREILADGGEGVFLDDVNIDIGRMFVRNGGGAPLTDFTAQSYYQSPVTGRVGWQALLGDFLHDIINRVRSGIGGTAFPGAKFIINPFWQQNPTARWTDEDMARIVDATDWVVIEHGLTDTGLTGGVGSDTGSDFALRSMLRWWDFIHSRGKSVILYAGSATAAEAKYEVAGYMAKREGNDLIGIWDEADAWPTIDPAFYSDLGSRTEYVDPGTAGSTIHAEHRGGYVEMTPVTFSSAVITGAPEPTVPASYDTVVAADGGLAAWDLDETSGVYDDSIGTRDLTADAATGTLTRGEPPLVLPTGFSTRFQNSARAFVASDAGLRLEGAFSIELWLRASVPGSGFPWIIRKGSGTALGSWQLYMIGSNGNLAFKRDNQDRNLSPAAVATGQRYHVVVTYDPVAQELLVYMNGALAKTFTAVTFSTGNTETNAFEIGSTTGGGDHTVDKVRLYAAALSPTRISEHYNAGIAADGPFVPLHVVRATSFALLTVTAATTGQDVPLAAAAAAASATATVTAPTRVPLAAASAAATGVAALTAPTRVPLNSGASVASATLALTAPTAVALNPAAAVATGAGALTAPTRVSLNSAAAAASGASLPLTAPTSTPLSTATAAATGTLAVTAATGLPLSAAAATGSAALALTAPTQVPLNAAAAVATGAATVSAPGAQIMPFAAAPAVASATLALTAPTRVALAAAAASGSATLSATAPTRVPLAGASAAAAASLSVLATTAVPLAASVAAAAGSLSITAPTRIALNAAPATATGSLALTGPTSFPISPAAATASATLALTAPARLTLAASAAAAAALTLQALPFVPLASAAATAASSVAITAPTAVGLNAAASQAAASLAATSPVTLPLAGATAQGAVSLSISAPTRVALAAAAATVSTAGAVSRPERVPLAPAAATSTGASFTIEVLPYVVTAASVATSGATLNLTTGARPGLNPTTPQASGAMQFSTKTYFIALYATAVSSGANIVLRNGVPLTVVPAAARASGVLALRRAEPVPFVSSTATAGGSLAIVLGFGTFPPSPSGRVGEPVAGAVARARGGRVARPAAGTIE